MMKTRIVKQGIVPCLEITDDNAQKCMGAISLPLYAYMTYFEERGDYKKAYERGVRLFSVCCATAKRPINGISGFSPHSEGIFDKGEDGCYDYLFSCLENIKRDCPDAYVFLRVYLAETKEWTDKNEDECTITKKGDRRECNFSQSYREHMGGLVRKVIERLEESKFADMIAGYQMSGGNTEEWFCLDLEGCTSGKGAYKPFCRYLEKKGIEPPNALPSLEDLNNIADDVYVREYLDFVNIESARTVEYFCKCAKEACGYRKMIGAFYGYSLEVPSPLWGTHALYSIIDSPYIDFFSSPNSYATSRAPGVDWGDMIPAGSVKLHGKHLFSECDVRTTLTLAPECSRPGSDRERFYSSDIWKGPEKIEVSASVMAKSAAHQLAGGYGMWLFDMFGHWYDNGDLMRVIEDYSELYKLAGESKLCEPIAGKLAVFADETMYRKVKWGEECSHALIDMREGLANVGVPFDVYLIEDFERVMGKENIGAVVFMIPCDSEYKDRGIDYCKREGIEYLEATGEKWKFTPCEYRELMKRSSSHVYSESEDVVYVGEGVISLHAAHSGEKKLTLPGKVKVRACVATPYDKEEQKEYRATERGKTTEIEFSCQQYETVTFVCEF